MSRCARCGETWPANVAVCDCGAPLVESGPEDAVPLDELEREALAARLPEEERSAPPGDPAPGRFLGAAALGGFIGYLEIAGADRLALVIGDAGGFGLSTAASFALPGLLSVVARRFSGRRSAVLRFLALACLLGAIAWWSLLGFFALGIGNLRLG